MLLKYLGRCFIILTASFLIGKGESVKSLDLLSVLNDKVIISVKVIRGFIRNHENHES